MAQMATSGALKRTPFHAIHAALGAKLVPFAGYEMAVQYPAGISAEHKAVRERCGLFDVSHMGEFIVSGAQALELLNAVTSNDVGALAVGQAQYSTLLNERGTIEDDLLIYRLPDRYMVVVNASNRAKDLEHLNRHAVQFDCEIADESDETALLALQGPRAQELLAPHTEVRLDDIAYYHFTTGAVAGVRDVIVARTGYTGEDGFELYFPGEHAEAVWTALTRSGEVAPAGLGARDSLRLEMGYALYGNDIDDTVTPLEANLGWLVKMKKGDFVGRAALERQKAEGIPRRLVGFTTAERAFPRHGYPVFHEGAPSGIVRSGTVSPTLGTPIGTCYLPRAATEGTDFEVEIRGKRIEARVVKLPFYTGGSVRK